MKVVALAGGTGSAKLLRGLARVGDDLTVVANVGDNIWIYGVYVCPDVDIACYTLAGMADQTKGWGIAGDTFQVLAVLRSLGEETWFALGDRDLGTCLRRTKSLRDGATLTEAVDQERRALKVRQRVLPATDDPLETRIGTERGEIHLQEFWVKEGGRPAVKSVRYRGARRAKTSPAVLSAVKGADRVVVCPANPVTSIGPMLAIPGFREALSRTRARVSALSPMQGGAPFSGPAGKLMKACGLSQDSAGVARFYSGFLDAIVISEGDRGLRGEIESMGVECVASDTLISGPGVEQRLARELLEV